MLAWVRTSLQVTAESWWQLENKKLSYRRDSARRRSLRHATLLKVTNVSTNRKPVYDFLLVNNTNFHSISHCCPVSAQYRTVKLSPLTRDVWMSLANALVLGPRCEHRHKSYINKTRFFELHFLRRHYGSSTTFTLLAPKLPSSAE